MRTSDTGGQAANAVSRNAEITKAQRQGVCTAWQASVLNIAHCFCPSFLSSSFFRGAVLYQKVAVQALTIALPVFADKFCVIFTQHRQLYAHKFVVSLAYREHDAVFAPLQAVGILRSYWSCRAFVENLKCTAHLARAASVSEAGPI